MTTFGNPYDNQYHSTSVQSGKSKRAAAQNQKESRKQKKAKAKGQNVDRGSKHGGYDGKGGGKKKGGGGGRRGGGGGRSGRTGGGGGGGGGGGYDVGGGIFGIVQFIVAAAAIGQLIVGIIHTVNLLDNMEYCPDFDSVDCVGDSLFWNIEDANGDSTCPIGADTDTDSTTVYSPWTYCKNADTSSYMNWSWRQGPFTTNPDLFVLHWTPLIFGMIAICQCIGGFQSFWISGSYLKCLLFHIVMMLFACFGYAGQAGIVIGFIQAFAGFCLFIMLFVGGGGSPYPTFYLCF